MKMRQISRPALDDMRAAAGNPNAVSLTRLLKMSFVQGPACLGGMFIYGIWLSAFHVGHYLVTCSQEGGRQLVLCSAAGLAGGKESEGVNRASEVLPFFLLSERQFCFLLLAEEEVNVLDGAKCKCFLLIWLGHPPPPIHLMYNLI